MKLKGRDIDGESQDDSHDCRRDNGDHHADGSQSVLSVTTLGWLAALINDLHYLLPVTVDRKAACTSRSRRANRCYRTTQP